MKPKIVFMGTPEFAAYCLEQLLNNNYTVVGAVTVPDKAAGRGKKMNQSAVKKTALLHNIPLAQPEKLKDEAFHEKLKEWNADIFVVVAFRMLPKSVWTLPEKGTFNLHASILPQYRGAAPINWAIINGEKESGVSTFLIDEKIDTGGILLQERIDITETMTAGELHDKLMHIGAPLIMKTIDGLANNSLSPIAQPKEISLKDAPKLFKEDGQINWNKSIEAIYNHIKGLSPYPAAWSKIQLNDQVLNFKILQVTVENFQHEYAIKEIIRTKNEMKIAVKDGYINIIEAQIEGKKPQQIKDLLNGIVNFESVQLL